MKNTVAIIQARSGSTRLPGKVLISLCGKTVLQHVVERVQQMKTLDEIILATTIEACDDAIAKLARDLGVVCFRGSEQDVLSRYHYAAEMVEADHVVRITSDCPLYDPRVGDAVVTFYHNNPYDIVSNAGAMDSPRTYPPGLDTEVFSAAVLSHAFENAVKPYQREHVTPYIYENPDCRVHHFHHQADLSHFRWTLDTEEDLALIRSVYECLYAGRHDFYMPDIVDLMKNHPELAGLNGKVRQKKYQECAVG